MKFMNSGNRNSGQTYKYQPYQPDTIDRFNIDRLQRGSAAKDPDPFSAAAEAAYERSTNNQVNRDRNSAIEANRIADMAGNRDTANKIKLMREDAAIKNGNSDPVAASIAERNANAKNNLDYLRQSGEADKNRYQQSLDRDSQKQLASMSQENDRKLAAINQQTQLADQQSRIQQAAISARAQVSSAILGNRPNFGGYW